MTGTDLWQKAEALLPRLKERAPKCEQLRRLPDETLRDFHDAQLFRIHQPKRVGGAELEFAGAVVLHRDGGTWHPIETGSIRALRAVTGSPGRVMVAGLGGAILAKSR